jgi:hypothetical protein
MNEVQNTILKAESISPSFEENFEK